MSDEEEEVEKELIKIDYDEIDKETGFKKIEWQIWQALEAWKATPEEDREPAGDPSDMDSKLEWAKWFASEGPLKPNTDDPKSLSTFEVRCTAVIRLGIFAGARDKYNERTGKARAIYNNGDTFEGKYFGGKRNGQGRYVNVSQGKSELDTLLEKLVMSLPEDERVFMPLNNSWSVVSSNHDDFIKQASTSLCCSTVVVACALEFGFYPFYYGDYQNGVRNGIGVMKMKDGSVYKGEWCDGKRQGQGIFYYVNGDTYSGHWKNGTKCGFGTYSFAYWEKSYDSKTGKPLYTYSPGGDYRGEWGEEAFDFEEDGEKTRKVKKGVIKEGEWRMPDGLYYEGTFNRDFQPHTLDQPPAIYSPNVAPPPLNTYMHFPKWDLLQAGVMRKGQWAPQMKLIAVETPDEGGY
eukprot:TRINITY_DN8602_c0_g5_i1.p1 TRINITY_DN8602_c0_g5~~TRINITY_DN8602_c0_g5_i1.p1  ORF type:complete len:422 (+),score=102.39 TRINITY_DN8602_c0_g5_i1:53-1267(+)